MTTPQQNYKIIHHINKTLDYWSRKPITVVLGGLAITFFMTMMLIGSALFWISGLGFNIGNAHSVQSNSQTASSGLETIKRMVGNEQVWSENIQREYADLFPNEFAESRLIIPSYNDNFVGQKH